MLINFVYSTETKSSIFTDIEGYFRQYLPEKWELLSSTKPVEGADVYHYHRPHLDVEILPNSIATVHHDLNDFHPTLKQDLFVEAYKRMEQIVCLNQIQLQVLRDVGIENCCVIPHGVNSQLFKRKERALHDGKLTLGVASKRYGHFVKGEKYWYEMLHSLDPGLFKFVLVGENRCQDEPILKKFGFDSVVFDNLPYVLYPSFYDEIDLLCVFSVAEGGPANIPEAIQCGVPILGRDVGMIPDAISEGNGILLPESPIEAGRLLNSLTQESKDVLNSLFKAASSIPLPLTWQEVVDGYVKVYRNVANKTTVIS